MKRLVGIPILLLTHYSFAQLEQPFATSAEERLQGHKQRIEIEANSILSEIILKNVGPAIFSARVVDIEVHPLDPSIFYVADASGGLAYGRLLTTEPSLIQFLIMRW